MSRFVAKRTPFGGARGRVMAGMLATGPNKRAAKLDKSRYTQKILLAARNRYPKLATRGWVNNNSELKYHDVASAAYAGDTTGTVTALNLTAVGDDNTSRDGRQICNRSVQILGHVYATGDGSLNTFSRLLLVWDSQPNSAGAVPAITDILVASTSNSMLNLDNRERFSILRDLKFSTGPVSTTATMAYAGSPTNHVVDIFLNLKDIKTTYSGTTATIGSVATGSLLMVTIGNRAAGAAATFTLNTRVRFTDR